jgi:hypothetical protein
VGMGIMLRETILYYLSYFNKTCLEGSSKMSLTVAWRLCGVLGHTLRPHPQERKKERKRRILVKRGCLEGISKMSLLPLRELSVSGMYV